MARNDLHVFEVSLLLNLCSKGYEIRIVLFVNVRQNLEGNWMKDYWVAISWLIPVFCISEGEINIMVLVERNRDAVLNFEFYDISLKWLRRTPIGCQIEKKGNRESDAYYIKSFIP